MTGLTHRLAAWSARFNPLRQSAFEFLQSPFLKQLLHPAPEAAPVTLTQRRLYILPTRHGLIFALMLLVMLLGSINYANSMGFVLTFLLGSLAVVSILHTYRNLAQLTISAGKSAPVFVGQEARFHLSASNTGNIPRYAIGLRAGKDVAGFTDVAPNHAAALAFGLPAQRRGLLRAPSFNLFSTFPLGLFRTWTHLDLDINCLVYPRPAAEALPLPAFQAQTGQGSRHGAGQEDFSGLRTYRNGDSLRHVAWKAVAREQGMLTKQFDGATQQELWLDWDLLPGMDVETRLSRLTRWVLDADTAAQRYGLRLPGRVLSPASGAEHRRQCLETLALFGL
ncbi:hypothetical protein SKTS_12020 [Sulfurimicrobium lacus]|uniref:Uncharacterized protein n=1 Tax=Sulfurimicrobium lacus TaxID=2715678 RepID=A0A6F8VBD2_9PROT|nr:DUF58 domain-containing protein [Sulfurimicrobium lacus]BCB26316.1 hypothetical protein SKTS_12020 [Sulfurimicrobium lacus]